MLLDGQVWATSGATVEHARVTTNISSLLSAALRGRPCAVFSPDLRTIPALREVVFAAHDRREIEVVRREADGSWSRHVFTDIVHLASLDGVDRSVAEIYRDPLTAP